MQITLARLAAATLTSCLAFTACDRLHQGPAASDIDTAVRRALDAENTGGLNALAGSPLPTSGSVASVKPDGDCTKTDGSNGGDAFTCSVSIILKQGESGDEGATLHAQLQFARDSDGHWQTSGVDRAIAVGTATSLVDQAGRALSGLAASNPQ